MRQQTGYETVEEREAREKGKAMDMTQIHDKILGASIQIEELKLEVKELKTAYNEWLNKSEPKREEQTGADSPAELALDDYIKRVMAASPSSLLVISRFDFKDGFRKGVEWLANRTKTDPRFTSYLDQCAIKRDSLEGTR